MREVIEEGEEEGAVHKSQKRVKRDTARRQMIVERADRALGGSH